ncbi:MAG: PDZ domain-containing protein [Asgard group archaeon]|nr:PDZ domain-containing protein [Asgard group archaeon]
MLQELEQKIVDVVEKVLPCVVSVSTVVLKQIDMFRVAPLQGQGSGVIVDEKGIILTNAHVVRNAREVQIQLHNGKKLEAQVLGQLQGQDIAVLQVEADKELKAITIGESDTLKVGQFAIAVGNPLGLGESVTFGLISALNRTINAQNTQLEGLIQTTADINPGNSGGALINTNGELVGIPTAVIQYSQGIGFAIAIDSIAGLLDEFHRTGKVTTPWLGVVGATIDKRMVGQYKLPVDKGALIVDVPVGPARKAGLKPGDIIVSFNNDDVTSIQGLTKVITQHAVGDEVKVGVQRNKQKFDLVIKLGQSPR